MADMTWMQLFLPVMSVLLGAGITYWLNVRTRRRSRVEDVLYDAISAVAVAEASHDYITAIGPWRGATEQQHQQFNAELGRIGNSRYVEAVADARASLAKASAYVPELRPYYRDRSRDDVYRHAEEIIAQLRAALDRRR
jgi:hypothetical protein